MAMQSRRKSERDPEDRDGWLFVMLAVCVSGIVVAIATANVHPFGTFRVLRAALIGYRPPATFR